MGAFNDFVQFYLIQNVFISSFTSARLFKPFASIGFFEIKIVCNMGVTSLSLIQIVALTGFCSQEEHEIFLVLSFLFPLRAIKCLVNDCLHVSNQKRGWLLPDVFNAKSCGFIFTTSNKSSDDLYCRARPWIVFSVWHSRSQRTIAWKERLWDEKLKFDCLLCVFLISNKNRTLYIVEVFRHFADAQKMIS